jgi:hypothetical protein
MLSLPWLIAAQAEPTSPVTIHIGPWVAAVSIGPSLYFLAKAWRELSEWFRQRQDGHGQAVTITTAPSDAMLARQEGADMADLHNGLDHTVKLCEAIRGSLSLILERVNDAMTDQSQRLERLESAFRLNGQSLDRLTLATEANTRALDILVPVPPPADITGKLRGRRGKP